MNIENIISEWDHYIYLATLFVKTVEPADLQNVGYEWLDRIKSLDESNNANLRARILKLMLTTLQNNRLVEPFTKNPPKNDKDLKIMMCSLKPAKISNRITHQTLEELLVSEPVPPLPVSSGCYTVLQIIPEYGGHFYNTSSAEAIKCSNDLGNKQLPIGTKFIFPAYCAKQLYNAANDERLGKMSKTDE